MEPLKAKLFSYYKIMSEIKKYPKLRDYMALD